MKVQQMVSNLKKNIAHDEDIIEQLRAKKHDTIIRDFR